MISVGGVPVQYNGVVAGAGALILQIEAVKYIWAGEKYEFNTFLSFHSREDMLVQVEGSAGKRSQNYDEFIEYNVVWLDVDLIDEDHMVLAYSCALECILKVGPDIVEWALTSLVG